MAIKKFLTEILVDPLSGRSLLYDDIRNILHTEDLNKSYQLLGEVPVLLTGNIAVADTSLLHKTPGTGFNYTQHYQKDAEVFNYFKSEENAVTKNELLRLHQAILKTVPKEAGLVLDVGCGNGWLAKHLLKKNMKLISMDISTLNPVRVLKENPDKNHAALVADVFNLPIKNRSIDCVVASEIMEHVPDPALFINKLIEKLKPGGKLIITTPYNEKIEYYLCMHCNLPTPKNAHLHSFNKQNIKLIIPGKEASWRAKSFANKYLIRSRLNLLLGFLPFKQWILVDKGANAIFNVPTRFIIEIIKK